MVGRGLMWPVTCSGLRDPGCHQSQPCSQHTTMLSHHPHAPPLQDLVAEVPAAKAMFDKASEILGYDLLKVGVVCGVYMRMNRGSRQRMNRGSACSPTPFNTRRPSMWARPTV